MKRKFTRTEVRTLRLLLVAFIGAFALVCFAQPEAPEVNVEIVTIEDVDFVRLSWEPVDEAEGYNIYASDVPDPEDWGEPIATVEADVNEYLEALDHSEIVQCYFVTAFSELLIPEEMVLIEGGDLYDEPVSSFYISKYLVTQRNYELVMEDTPVDNTPSYFEDNPDNPVERVSWYNAVEYCNRLSMMQGLTPVYSYLDAGTDPDNWYEEHPGWNEDDDNHTDFSFDAEADGYRLPTGEEWEFAARGGIRGQANETFDDRWAGTDNEEELENYNWFRPNASEVGEEHPNYGTNPVGTKLPNELDLFDMSGNVMELTWEEETQPFVGRIRVMRCGSWTDNEWDCRITFTRVLRATVADRRNVGFRVVRSVVE